MGDALSSEVVVSGHCGVTLGCSSLNCKALLRPWMGGSEPTSVSMTAKSPAFDPDLLAEPVDELRGDELKVSSTDG